VDHAGELNALIGILAYAMVRRFLRDTEQKTMFRTAPCLLECRNAARLSIS
jgi:hypothetical protein